MNSLLKFHAFLALEPSQEKNATPRRKWHGNMSARVQPKLRWGGHPWDRCHTPGQALLIRAVMEAGHGGQPGNDKLIRERQARLAQLRIKRKRLRRKYEKLLEDEKQLHVRFIGVNLWEMGGIESSHIRREQMKLERELMELRQRSYDQQQELRNLRRQLRNLTDDDDIDVDTEEESSESSEFQDSKYFRSGFHEGGGMEDDREAEGLGGHEWEEIEELDEDRITEILKGMNLLSGIWVLGGNKGWEVWEDDLLSEGEVVGDSSSDENDE
eukprot:1328216-Amorphochlora_amoeboformis.AAC.1